MNKSMLLFGSYFVLGCTPGSSGVGADILPNGWDTSADASAGTAAEVASLDVASDSESDAQQPSAQELYEVFAPLAAASCDLLVSCCDASEKARYADLLGLTTFDAPSCTSEISDLWNGAIDDIIIPQLGPDTLVFRPELVADCLAALQGGAQTCPAAGEIPEPLAGGSGVCGAFLEAQIPLGGACADGNAAITCVGDAVCANNTCVLPGTLGEPCSFDAPCEVLLKCDFSGTETCIQPLPGGASCGNPADCASFQCDGGVCAALPDPIVCDGP